MKELHSQENGQPEKWPRTERSETETEAAGGEVGPSQLCYKKGHMTNIYLTDSDEETIVDFVKDHEETKTNEHFKNKARKESLWKELARSRNLYKTWFDSQRTRYGKLTQSKSGQAPKEMTERQNWIQCKLGFLKSHMRCKGLSKSSAFKSQAQGASASATTAHNISRASTDTDGMEISMRSIDTMLQPQHIMSPTAASGCLQSTSSSWPVHTDMRTVLSLFLWKNQETTICTAFCNYLALEVEE